MISYCGTWFLIPDFCVLVILSTVWDIKIFSSQNLHLTSLLFGNNHFFCPICLCVRIVSSWTCQSELSLFVCMLWVYWVCMSMDWANIEPCCLTSITKATYSSTNTNFFDLWILNVLCWYSTLFHYLTLICFGFGSFPRQYWLWAVLQ